MLRTSETGAARKDARLAAIMIHGRGRTPEEMAELGAALAVDGVRYYSPGSARRQLVSRPLHGAVRSEPAGARRRRWPASKALSSGW